MPRNLFAYAALAFPATLVLATAMTGCSAGPTAEETAAATTATEQGLTACTDPFYLNQYCGSGSGGTCWQCVPVTEPPRGDPSQWPQTTTIIPPPSAFPRCSVGLSISNLTGGVAIGRSYTANVWACPNNLVVPETGLGAAPVCHTDAGSESSRCEITHVFTGMFSNPYVGTPETHYVVLEEVIFDFEALDSGESINTNCNTGCMIPH
jgi:hypothetical protein